MKNKYSMAINHALLYGSGQIMIDCNCNVQNIDYKDIYIKHFNNRVSRMNAKSYSYKPRFIRARAAKKINSQPITFDF